MHPKKRKTSKKKSSPRKKYSRPELVEYGSVREFTHVVTGMCGLDGGAAPNNRTMACISPAPFVEEHRHLIGDETLQSLYRKAIHDAVRPGDVVLDLGTGSGLHAFFACEAGASKVYAIESEGIIAIAQAAARRNGFGDRIEFLYGNSHDLELPEKVDVIISNIGYLSSLQHLPDAARRFLKPGGRLVPHAVYNSFVPITSKRFYEERIHFWNRKHYGYDFSDFAPFVLNRAHANHVGKESFLAEAEDLTPIDLTRPLGSEYRWHCEFTAKREGTVYGLLGWYSFDLGNGHLLTTKPPLFLSPVVWTHPFLPCSEPFRVKRGQSLKVGMTMYLKGSFEEPIWRWEIESGAVHLDQNSFSAIPLSPQILKKIAVPVRDEA